MRRFGWVVTAMCALIAQPSPAQFASLLGMGGDMAFCKHQKKGRLKVVTAFGLRVGEAQATNTTLRTLALMARDQNIAAFRMAKVACGTLLIGGAERGRQCMLIADPAEPTDATSYTRDSIIETGKVFDTTATLRALAAGYIPLPVMHSIMKAGDACPIS